MPSASASKRKASVASASTSAGPTTLSSSSSSSVTSPSSRVFTSLRKTASGFFSSLTPKGKRRAQQVANEPVTVTDPLVSPSLAAFTPPAKKRARIDAPDSLGREESRRLFALLNDEEQPGFDREMVQRLEQEAVATIVRPRVLDPEEEMRDDEEIEGALSAEPAQPQAGPSRLPAASKDDEEQPSVAEEAKELSRRTPPMSPTSPTRRSPRSKGKQKAVEDAPLEEERETSNGVAHINGAESEAEAEPEQPALLAKPPSPAPLLEPSPPADEVEEMDIQEDGHELPSETLTAPTTNGAHTEQMQEDSTTMSLPNDTIATSTTEPAEGLAEADVKPAVLETTDPAGQNPSSVNGGLEAIPSAAESAPAPALSPSLYPSIPTALVMPMEATQPSGDALTEEVSPVESEVLAGEEEGLRASEEVENEEAHADEEMAAAGVEETQDDAQEAAAHEDVSVEQAGDPEPGVAMTTLETGEPEDIIVPPVNGHDDDEAEAAMPAPIAPAVFEAVNSAATEPARVIEVIDFTAEDDSSSSSDDEVILVPRRSPAAPTYRQQPSSGFLRGPLAAQSTSRQPLHAPQQHGSSSADATSVIRRMGRISLDQRHQASRHYTPSVSARSPSEMRDDVSFNSSFGGLSTSGSRIRPKRAPIGEKDHKRHLQQARRSSSHTMTSSPSLGGSALRHHPHAALHSNLDDATSLARYRQHLANALGPPTPIQPRPAAVAGLKTKFHPSARESSSARLRNLELLLQKSRYAKSKIVVPPSKELLRLRREEKERERKRRGILGRPPLPNSLEPDQEAAVQRILSDGSWKVSIPGATATNRDVSMLRPRQWMNDETITFYMTMINERSKKADAERAKAVSAAASNPGTKTDKKWNAFYRVHSFNSYFWAKLSTEGYTSVSRWTRRIDIFAQDLILIPCNLGNSHWTCAAVNFRRKRIEYYDSMGGRNGRVVEKLREYLRCEQRDKKRGEGVDVDSFGEYFGGGRSPQQRNGFDCGVFVCSTLEQLSRRDPFYPFDQDPEEEEEEEEDWVDDDDSMGYLNGHAAGGGRGGGGYQWNFSQDDMPYMRRRIIYEISQKALLD